MSSPPVFKFRFYVAGDAPNSVRALANLTALCQEYLPDRHEIEIVDVFKDPKRAMVDNIFMTPTLIKLSPDPVCRIVGTLSQLDIVLQALELEKSMT